MSITRKQACDLLAFNYDPCWSWDDPEWWADMVESLMERPSVKRLRHPLDGDPFGGLDWRIPDWWDGQSKHGTR